MLALFNQISTPVLVGSIVIIVLFNTLLLKWFLDKMQSEPADDEIDPQLPVASASTSPLLTAKPTPGAPSTAAEPETVRTTAGTPRVKPLQPVEPPPVTAKTADSALVRLTSMSASAPASEVGLANAAEAGLPKSSLPTPVSALEPALAAVGASITPKDPETRPAISLTKDRGAAVSGAPSAGAAAVTPSASLTAIPNNKTADKSAVLPMAAPHTGIGEGVVDKPSGESHKIAPSISPAATAPTDKSAPAPAQEPIVDPILPKLNLTKESIAPTVPASGKTATAPPHPITGALGPAPTAGLISVDNPATPLASVTTSPTPKAEIAVPEVKPTPKPEAEEMPKPPAKTPASEPSPASAGLIAVSNKPVAKPEPLSAEKEPLASARSGLIAIPTKNEAEATPASGGLMLMPDAPTAVDKTAEAASSPAAGPQKTKLLGRPRIFLPTNPPAAMPESPAAAPVESKLPKSPAAEVEVPTPAPETTPVPVPSQPDVPVPTAPEMPTPSEPSLPVAPEVESPAEPSPAAEPQAIAEEPAAPAFMAKPLVSPKPEESALSSPPAVAPFGSLTFHPNSPAVDPTPALAPTPAQQPSIASPFASEEKPATITPLAQKPVAVSGVPSIEPETPVTPAMTTPSIQPVPTHTPRRPAMAQNENTTSQASGGRASAQLTLGFEITSLQLTPFFKLGAVQLRPLSNIVSLHLINDQQADNPLAAGISFQIDTVELDGASHIRSILLKPQPTATPATTPQPKLQVDNVQFSQATEGAPIQITSSQATSTAVQLLATCTIAAMDFTPSFEIGSLRLEPASNFVMLRLAPSSRPAALDLPPSFEVAAVQLEGESQISTVRLIPGSAPK